MKDGNCFRRQDSEPRLAIFGLLGVLMLVLALAGCGSDDAAAAAQSCTFHSDCELGYVCSFEDECIQTSCDNCQDSTSDLVCLKTPQHPDGVCSSPQCKTDAQCDEAAGESCQSGLCVGEDGGDTTCNSDNDCPGTDVCGLNNECVPNPDGGSDDCDSNNPCPSGQICDLSNHCVDDPNANNPPGDSCTKSEDCGDGSYCDPDTNECASGECANSTECPDDETCNSAHQCVAGDSEACGGGCPSGQTCNTATDECEDEAPATACDPACGSGEVCDSSTGECVENNCPPGSQTPETCSSDPVYNLFNAEGCFCAQCLADSDCDVANGETCAPNGECMRCNESCDASQGSDACSGDGFFCINECCVECTGNSDCPVTGEVCVDGQCQQPPDCSQDPTVCRAGTVCLDDGVCGPPGAGGSCTSASDCSIFQECVNGRCEDGAMGPGGDIPGMDGLGCEDDSSCATGEICAFGLMCLPGCPSDCMMCMGGTVCLF